MKNKLCFVVTTLLIMISSIGFAQTSLVTFRKQIDSILIEIVGKEDFAKHISFNDWRSHCSLVRSNKSLGNSDFRKDIIKFKPDRYYLWYDLDFVQGTYKESISDYVYIVVSVNDTQTHVSIRGLPKCFGDSICGHYLTKDSALIVAEKLKLDKGLTTWKAEFNWNKTGVEYLQNGTMKIVLDKGFYVWSVSNVLSIISPEPCLNGAGECLRVNAFTGEFVGKDNIDYGCVY